MRKGQNLLSTQLNIKSRFIYFYFFIWTQPLILGIYQTFYDQLTYSIDQYNHVYK